MREPRWVEVKGHRFAVWERGEGTPVVFLHGITTWGFVWEPVLDLLPAGYRLVAPDLLGCGYSDKPPGVDYSPGAQARLVTGLLDRLGIGRAHWVGHDVGGAVAQIAAVEQPGRFRTLTLLNTVGYDYWPVQPIKTLRIPVIRQLALGAFDLGAFRLVLRRAFLRKDRLTDEVFRRFREPLETPEGRRGFLHFARCLDPAQLLRAARRFPEIPFPVLVVRGDADAYLSPAIAARLAREIPGARLERLPAAGHFVQFDDPEGVAGLLAEFWRAEHG